MASGGSNGSMRRHRTSKRGAYRDYRLAKRPIRQWKKPKRDGDPLKEHVERVESTLAAVWPDAQ